MTTRTRMIVGWRLCPWLPSSSRFLTGTVDFCTSPHNFEFVELPWKRLYADRSFNRPVSRGRDPVRADCGRRWFLENHDLPRVAAFDEAGLGPARGRAICSTSTRLRGRCSVSQGRGRLPDAVVPPSVSSMLMAATPSGRPSPGAPPPRPAPARASRLAGPGCPSWGTQRASVSGRRRRTRSRRFHLTCCVAALRRGIPPCRTARSAPSLPLRVCSPGSGRPTGQVPRGGPGRHGGRVRGSARRPADVADSSSRRPRSRAGGRWLRSHAPASTHLCRGSHPGRDVQPRGGTAGATGTARRAQVSPGEPRSAEVSPGEPRPYAVLGAEEAGRAARHQRWAGPSRGRRPRPGAAG